MKRILTFVLGIILLYSCSDSEKRSKEDLSEYEINKLMYEAYFHRKDYSKCIPLLDENLKILTETKMDTTEYINTLDSKHYVLMQINEWEEALETGKKLEEFSSNISINSPWNCLKIADCYIGLNDADNAMYWISKAVNERDFKNYDILLGNNFKLLHNNNDFNELVKTMKLKNAGVGQKAKSFEVKLLDGSIFDLDEKKGKVVLLYFWSTSCKPCIKSLPLLIDLQKQYSKDEFEILAISLDENEKKLNQFLEKNIIDLNIACNYSGVRKDPTARLYGVNATPSSWLIDKNGMVQNYNLNYDELKSAVFNLAKAP